MSNFLNNLLQQCRKPSGLYGRLVAFRMNYSHSPLTDWGLAHLTIDEKATILDVGCGGGRTIQKLAALTPRGIVHGLDYSHDSLAVAGRKNRKLIKAGRVELKQGSVSQLPYSDAMFDTVTAVETYYFWPHLEADLREVLRVLKQGGELAIICEAYKGGKYEERNREWIDAGNMHYHTPAELGKLLEDAGYSQVQYYEQYEEGWMCVTGKKPG